MRDHPVLLTDGGEPVRKAQFETKDTEAAARLDAAGHFAIEKGEDKETADKYTDCDEVSKETGGLDVSDPSGGFGSGAREAVEKSADVDAGDADEWASIDLGDDGGGDGGSESVEKSVPSGAPTLDLNQQGSFLSKEARLLGEIRNALTERDEDVQAAFEKAVQDATDDSGDEAADLEGDDDGNNGANDPEGDRRDVFEVMLAESQAVVENAESLVETDTEDEDWADLKQQIDGLISRMEDAPKPSMPAEVAAVETVKERAATVADLVDPDAADGDEEGADGEGGADTGGGDD